jgi:hypothetical protein
LAWITGNHGEQFQAVKGILRPVDEVYRNYYAVYFEDPDGLEFEGMWYGKRKAA